MHDPSTAADVRPGSEAVLRADDRSPRRVRIDPVRESQRFSDAVNMAVARSLRAMKQRAGLPLTTIAVRANTHRPIVGRIMNGRHTVSLETSLRIARACGGELREVLEAIDRAIGLDGAV